MKEEMSDRNSLHSQKKLVAKQITEFVRWDFSARLKISWIKSLRQLNFLFEKNQEGEWGRVREKGEVEVWMRERMRRKEVEGRVGGGKRGKSFINQKLTVIRRLMGWMERRIGGRCCGRFGPHHSVLNIVFRSRMVQPHQSAAVFFLEFLQNDFYIKFEICIFENFSYHLRPKTHHILAKNAKVSSNLQ